MISQERDGRTYTYLYDGHGSVVGLADESGKVTDTYTYDAFGNLLKSTGRTANNYRYCGEQFDSTTGLYYLRARYMDTSTGRFISQDSYAGSVYDPVSLHKYLYANSNPVMYSDPSGYMGLADTMISCAIIGSLSGGMINVGMNLLRSLLGNQSMAARYSSPITAIISDFLDGMILGLFAGISVAALMAFGIGVAIVVATNFYFSYNYYCQCKNAVEYRQWDFVIYYGFLSIFYMVAGFTALSLADMPKPVDTDNNSGSEANSAEYNDNPGEYLNEKAPSQVEPGTKYLEGQYISNGKVQPWKAYYDEYGRLIARTDYNAENIKDGIPETHYHIIEYNAEFPNGHSIGDHIPGEYIP